MEVEFVYEVSGPDRWEELEAAAARAVKLNRNFTSYQIEVPAEGQTFGTVRLCSSGHNRSAIARRIVAPIRAVFHRAGVTPDRIRLIQQTIRPSGRHLTAEQGRTPKGTFASQELGQMLADAAKLEPSP